MNKSIVLILFILLASTFMFGHEGHRDMKKHPIHEQQTIEQFEGRPQSWMQWIGRFHFIFLHFSLALIAMVVVSELLFAWYLLPIFDYSSRFMIISAAILSIPTAALGLIYSYTATYNGLLADFVWWHMWTGIATTVLAVIAVFIRERYGISKLYYSCLTLLFLLLNITGFLGGGMTFGPYNMYLP